MAPVARPLRWQSAAGCTVVVVPMERETVGIAVAVGSGSAHEPSGWYGISHQLEHLVLRGSASFPHTTDLAQAIEGGGGGYGGQTDKEMTLFSARVPLTDWQTAARALLSVVGEPLLREGDLECEREVVAGEARIDAEQPLFALCTLLEGSVWPGALGRPPDGAGPMARFGREQLLRWWQEAYHPSRVSVVIAGDVAEAEVRQVVDAMIRSRPHGGAPRVTPGAEIGAGGIEWREGSGRQAMVALGGAVPGLDRGQPYAAQVLSALLGDGWGSRLHRALREGLGTGYDAHSLLLVHRAAGFLGGVASAQVDEIGEVARVIAGQWRELAAGSVTPDEVAQAVRQVAGAYALEVEGPQGAANRAAVDCCLLGRPRTKDEVAQGVAGVDLAAVRRLAASAMERSTCALVVPAGTYADHLANTQIGATVAA